MASDIDLDTLIAETPAAKPTELDELDQLIAATPAAPKISKAESFARGARQGATLGFADELGGALQGFLQYHANRAPKGALDFLGIENRYGSQDVGDVYREARDENRAEEQRAKEANSGMYLAGEIAGGAAIPIPGGAAAQGAKWTARLGKALAAGAGMGAAYGLGSSEADLTKGELGRAAVDTGLGAVGGGLGGAAGEGVGLVLGKAVRAARRRASRGIKDAVDAEAARQAELIAKSIASAKGAYGQSVGAASRDLEVLGREAAALPEGETRQAAEAFLSSPEGVALREQVARGKLETGPERIGEMTSKKEVLQQLVEGQGETLPLQTAEALRSPIRKHVLPRAITLGYRMAPAALGAAGYYLGGGEGAAVGTGIGTVMSLTQGAPGRIIKNLMEKPAVRKAAWEAVQTVFRGNAEHGLVAKTLGTAMDKGERAFTATLYSLGERHPEATAAVLQKVAELGPEQPSPDDDSTRETIAALRQTR